MSHTQFNLKKSNKNLTQLLLRLAWLNLKDKHMTTVRVYRRFVSIIIRNCDAGPPNLSIPTGREKPIVRTMAKPIRLHLLLISSQYYKKNKN
jgi:hypothetical protein